MAEHSQVMMGLMSTGSGSDIAAVEPGLDAQWPCSRVGCHLPGALEQYDYFPCVTREKSVCGLY